MRFCPHCGGAIEKRKIEGRPRLFCPHCHRTHYRQLKVGAGALIEDQDRILLLQRTQPPFADCWNLPAGYAEADEDPAVAVVREVAEECGLAVQVEGLVDLYYFDDDPRGNGILILYRCRIEGGRLSESAEGRQPTFFAPAEIPSRLAGGGHDQAVRAWQRDHTNLSLKKTPF